MSGIQQLLLGGSPAAAAAVDPYFYSVTSLLHGDGTNGGQNNTFLDSSTNNFTITRNGNTTQGSFSPFSQTGWGNYFDGSGDGISFGSNVNTNPASSDITVEAWIYPLAYNSYGPIFSNDVNGGFHFGKIASGFGVRHYGTGDVVFTATTPALNQWTHVAVSRSGNSWYLFYNGIQVATATASNSFTQGTACVGGNASTAAEAWNGYLSNVRFVKGTALYTSNFTPSTTPLTAVSNTQLLTCQSNRFIDNSSNAYAATVFGTPSVQPFSPFNPTTAYSTSAVGGSGYFDGSGDYLTVPDNAAFDFGSGDFTISAWVYPQGAGAIIDQGGGGASSNRSFEIYMSNASTISNAYISSDGTYQAGYNLTGTTVPNAWNFIEFTRSSGTLRLFVNGVQQSSVSANVTIFNSTATVAIGNTSANAVNPYTGYISDVRVLKGTGSATSTVPTSPLTAVTNTQLLCSFTNGAIFDNAAVADYETVGNAQISTSVKKYGTGSMAFDGTGDYLVAPSRAVTSLSGDFTIEFWAYRNSGAFRGFTIGDDSLSSGLSLYYSTGSSAWIVYNANTNRISGGVSNTSVWYHMAVVRVAGIVKLYVNGTQAGSSWSSTGTFSGAVYVSAEYNAGTAYGDTNGYIDDFRISNGVARYPYNFTPPTAEFPNIGGTVTLTADPYYDYTTLLLPGNGTNGAQNNTFLDSSTNNFTITRNGNTTQGTFSPFSQTGWGNYFDGSGDYLSLADNAAFQYGTGDFTIEFWFYMSATAGSGNYYVLYDGRPSGTSSGAYVDIAINNATPESYVNGSTVITGSALSANTWYHFAYARSGTSTKMFVNGTQVGSTYTDTTNYVNGTARPVIGTNGFSVGTSNFNGYFSNYRVVKGTAVYTANFTPPTSPLTAITNTSLLTCQSNRFIDNSTNNFAITRNGDVSVQAFSPFNPTASWSAATYGGSGYFDGSGDYLTLASNTNLAMGSGDFTVDFWIYKATSGTQSILDYASSGGFGCFITDTQITAFITVSTTYPVNAVVPLNSWNHIAFVRSGTTLTTYLNGVSQGTNTTSTNFTSPSTLFIGRNAGAAIEHLNGYLSGLRLIKGSAVTPTLTAPPTAVTNTQLLCNFTNAGIYDATSKNDLETVGNAQISTTQSKFGGSSMLFDGNGDDLKIITNPPLSFSGFAGDFTIEAWVYPTATGQSNGSYLCAQTTSGSYGPIVILQSSGTYNFVIYMSSTGSSWNLASAASCGTATANAWNHIAVTRYGTNVYCFMNGILQSTTAVSTTAFMTTSANWHIGSADLVANSYLTGYIDDLRITKGIARYTSNFTPPTTAFLTQ